MCQFLETICIQEGRPQHLSWHQMRVNEVFAAYFPTHNPIDLAGFFSGRNFPDGKLRARLIYDKKIVSFAYFSYEIKDIKSIIFVETEKDYTYKFAKRTFIQEAMNQSEADEVIFVKNGTLLDSSIANLVLFKNGEWVTPTTYWLNGTTRRRLLSENKIVESPVQLSDLDQYEKISFINAMMNLGEAPQLELKSFL